MRHKTWEELQNLVLEHPEIRASTPGGRRVRLKHLTEHVRELWREVEIDNPKGIKYSLGALLIECIIHAEMNHTSTQECLDYAYRAIKACDKPPTQ